MKVFFDLYSKEPNTNLWNTNDLLKFADSMGGVDDNFKKFLSTADTSGDLMTQYQKHLQSASTATSKFGAAIKSAAINIGIMLVASAIISTLYKLSQASDEVAQKASK